VLGRATPAVPDLVPGAEFGAQRILVPLKLSEIGQEVLATALRLAEEGGSQVYVVNVIKVPMSLPLDAPDQEGEEEGRAALEEAREIAEDLGVAVTARVVRARSLAQAVLDEAEALHADLIVLGSAPRWRSQKRFFSPTVDEVLRRSPVEVMVVAYPEGVLLEEEGG
jgi:basic amino acid/polyamine antiporter, APA family